MFMLGTSLPEGSAEAMEFGPIGSLNGRHQVYQLTLAAALR
jgi:hypothetical protein